VTLDALRALWLARDALYARRKVPLSDAEVASVRWWRAREAGELPALQREAAWRDVMAWRAPLGGVQ
jgi:hypothetical protein